MVFCSFNRTFAALNYTINVRGRLMDLSVPRVMGILNATPDSFYAASRSQTEVELVRRARQIIDEGGDIIDVGACSTRPDSTPATEAEEMERLRLALGILRREMPDAVISVDTFRPAVARMAVEEYGADIINDVGAPSHSGDEEGGSMFRMVARLGVPYIYMSRAADIGTMIREMAQGVQQLRAFGQKDIIIDPGFGFGKMLEDNYGVMRDLQQLQVLGLPVLVGVSRKSMIYRLFDTQPEQALNGTTVLNTLALTKGASILRVHDVKEAVECVKIVAATESQPTGNK